MGQDVLQIILRARDEASRVIESATGSITRSFDKAVSASKVAALGLAAVATAIAGVGLVGATYAGELESMTVALETVTQSTEDAERAMATIKRTAAESPFFETGTLAQFVQIMAAAGQEIDAAVSSGIAFGDVMAAFGKGNAELGRLGNTLSQVIGKGRADIVDFRELVNAGWVSVRTDVAAAMGVSMAAFEEMVSAGEIGYDDIRKAAEKFAGSAAKQSSGWNATVSRMQESFKGFVANLVIDTGIFDALKDGMQAVIDFMDEHGDEIGAGIKSFIEWSKENWPILAGIITGMLVPAILAAAAAFGTAAMAMAPYILAGAAIGLLAKVIMDNWGPISGFFTNLWNGITTTIQNVVTWIGEKIQWFKDNWAYAIGYVIGFFATLPIKLPLLTIQAIVAIISYLASINWGSVFASIGHAFGGVWENVKNAARNAWNYISNLNWGAIVGGIGKGIGNAVIGLIEGAINGAISGIPGMKGIRLPRFDTGGIVPGAIGSPQLVIAHGGETILPTHKQGTPGQGLGQTIINVYAEIKDGFDVDALGQQLAWSMNKMGRL